MTTLLATTLPLHMRDSMLAAHPRLSETIRTALLNYAHKAKSIRVPDTHRPPKDPTQQTSVSAVIRPDSLRKEYEHRASMLGITVSELLLRCIYAHLTSQDRAESEAEPT